MKNILVATDLSERSDLAMNRAALLAQQMNALLHIVYVIDDEVSSTIALPLQECVSVELERQINVSPLFKGVKTKIYVEFGHPWRMIADLAEHHRADLLVLGAHRNRGIRELFSGTTLHRVAKACKVPLLVAISRATGPYKKVIVGVDFSECARLATDLASRISPEAPLTLINSYHIPFKSFTERGGKHGNILIREKKRLESEIRSHLSDFTVTLTNPNEDNVAIMKEGGPVEVLQEQAKVSNADLICIGSHGKPWLVDALLGNTAYELLMNSPCDVLAVPLR